jgi:hypothetical protein
VKIVNHSDHSQSIGNLRIEWRFDGLNPPMAPIADRHWLQVSGLAGRALCCRKPSMHKVSQHPACEAVVGEHNCLGARTVCWLLKCSPLFDTDMTF